MNQENHINTLKEKNFGPTTWSIRNRTSIYLLILFVTIGGIMQFITTPKEQFPDLVIPNIFIQTIYVGYSPTDIQNLVTQPIEKELKGITEVKINTISSTLSNDFYDNIMEYDAEVDIDVGL